MEHGEPDANSLQTNLQNFKDTAIEIAHILEKSRILFLSTQVKKFSIASKILLALCMSVDLQSNVNKS